LGRHWLGVGLLGCQVEDLTIVVLVHELAHAYTQNGADIEGRRWATISFAKAETALKEGLAQYYTDRAALRRFSQDFLGSATGASGTLSSPRAVGGKFIPGGRSPRHEVRRWNEGKLSDFNLRLAAAREGLDPARA
jgi:hypothetical protein